MYFEVATLMSFKTSFEILDFASRLSNKSISASSSFWLNLSKMGFFGPIDNVSSTTVSLTMNKGRSCCLERLSNFF